MKRTFFVASVLTCAARAFSQDGAAFLEQLPAPPANACNLLAQRQQYSLQIAKVTHDIDAALAKRRKEQKAYVKQNEAAWREQMMKQAGLTPELIAQMKEASRKRGKAGAASKRQIADQVLQQQTDLSIAEVENVKKMDKDAKQAWSQAYATQQLSTAQASAQAQTPAQQEAEEQKRVRLAKLASLAKDQSRLREETGAGRERLWNKMRDLDEEAQEAYKQKLAPIDDRLDQVKEEMRQLAEESKRMYARQAEVAAGNPGRAGDAQDIQFGEERREMGRRETELLDKRDRIELERDDALRLHCAAFTPRHCDLLRQYVTWAKEAQAGFARYEEMENEKFRLQTDSPNAGLLAATGTLGLEEAKACADLLQTAFKYALQDPNRPLDGSKRPDVGAAP